MSYQRILLFGNVGRDPETRTVQQGQNNVSVTSFSLAVSEKYKDRNNQEHENTEWFNIVCWRNVAETVEKFVKKGDKVFIDGKVRTRKYTSQSGEERSVTEVIVNTLQLAGQKAAPGQPEVSDSGSDDFPF